MKIKNKKLTRKGVTLIELTVVIAVVLTLIGVLFIGAQTYKRHADKSACIINQNSINKAVRAHVNLTGIETNWNFAQLTAQNLLPAIPFCPDSGVPYAVTDPNPAAAPGTRLSVCPSFDGAFNAVVPAVAGGGQRPAHTPDPQRIQGW